MRQEIRHHVKQIFLELQQAIRSLACLNIYIYIHINSEVFEYIYIYIWYIYIILRCGGILFVCHVGYLFPCDMAEGCLFGIRASIAAGSDTVLFGKT